MSILSVVIFFIGLYLLMALHEFGHAFFALICCDGTVYINLGGHSPVPIIKFKFRRVILQFNGLNPFSGYVFQKNVSSSLSKKTKVLICLGGPLFSTISLILVLLILTETSNVAVIIGLKNLLFTGVICTLFTIIPFTYPAWMPGSGGLVSDGLNIVKALKEDD